MNKHAILTRKEVEQLTSMSRTSIYRMMGKSEFPKQVRLSPSRVGWLAEDIDNWLQQRIDESRVA
ncbi:helix-turn-helix transcriptional regulator [Marinobacterium stanieri]|uniref:helix-turn-helix transcriptional regulator n=1 Tax=Marinobacterium stanieri TaxID=49186 RepID=UPI000255A0E1|nr:AlpA family phage regulatory protein [Marinobacterium stanieri]